MSLIRLLGIAKKYENQPVLREVFFRLATGDRVGLIGKNGAGKTTVLRLILGQEEATEGVVELAQDIRIGYFSQFSQLQGDLSLQQVLTALFAGIEQVAQELRTIEEALPTAALGAETDRLLARYADLVEQMNREDGWAYQHRIDSVLTQLGFRPADRVRPIQQLSGGWRNRAALAKILLEAPDVLLLDEPTNFLDVAGLTWLEEWLVNWRGALLIVSMIGTFSTRWSTVSSRLRTITSRSMRGTSPTTSASGRCATKHWSASFNTKRICWPLKLKPSPTVVWRGKTPARRCGGGGPISKSAASQRP